MNRTDVRTRGVPHFDRLDEDGVRTVHDASMHLVENVGVQLQHERARALVEEHGGTVDDDGVATIPRTVVEDCVAGAPSQFKLHARNPAKDVTVGGDAQPVRAPGYGPPNVRTYDGRRRRARLADYEDLVKLAQIEDVITCTGYHLCDPADADDEGKPYEMLRLALVLGDQPVMASARGGDRARACLEMVGIAVDDPDLRKPYVAGLINSVPPRRFDEEMLGALLAYAERGQPVIVSSFTMAGASGPANLPASMAQANAENLVGITLAQLVTPGAPVIYGVPCANVDDRYGSLSIGSPESALFVALAGQMARFYGLPSRGGGGLTDAKTVDFQGGLESTFLQVATAFSGIDFVLNATGILDSYGTISPEKFVLDCETLRYVDRFRAGFSAGSGDLPLDALADVRPAGHFLDRRDDSEGAFFRPTVVDKRAHEDWRSDGRKSAFEAARDRVRRLLDEYEKPPLDADVEARLDAYVEHSRSGDHRP